MEGSDKPSLKRIWWVSSHNTMIHFLMVSELCVGITVPNRWKRLQQASESKQDIKAFSIISAEIKKFF